MIFQDNGRENEDNSGSIFKIRGENVILKKPARRSVSRSRSLNEEEVVPMTELKSDFEEKF